MVYFPVTSLCGISLCPLRLYICAGIFLFILCKLWESCGQIDLCQQFCPENFSVFVLSVLSLLWQQPRRPFYPWTYGVWISASLSHQLFPFFYVIWNQCFRCLWFDMTDPTAFVFAGRKWSGILHGVDQFTQSMTLNAVIYSLSVWCAPVYTSILHTQPLLPHTIYSYMYILYYSSLCLSYFLRSLLWMFSQIPLWIWKVSQNTVYYVHYLYHRNIVLNETLLIFCHRRIMKYPQWQAK
jgi:hypothetical protein